MKIYFVFREGDVLDHKIVAESAEEAAIIFFQNLNKSKKKMFKIRISFETIITQTTALRGGI